MKKEKLIGDMTEEKAMKNTNEYLLLFFLENIKHNEDYVNNRPNKYCEVL